jgi:Ca-activated chloride channel homolog
MIRNLVSQTAHRFRASLSVFGSIVSLIAFCVAVPPRVAAQATQPSDDDEVLRTSTDLLLFPVRVRDKNGKRPAGLTEHDFSVTDPDTITSGLYFSAGVDRVAMVFALDESGSLRDIIGRQRDAALDLYERFSTKSQIAVLHFAQTTSIATRFSHEAEAARTAFDIHTQPNQHTAIFDAAAKAAEILDELPRVRSERRIVIIISDGLDNASVTKPSAVIEAARKQRASFYVIHVPLFEPREGRLSVRPPAKGFRDLAEKTGGKYFLVNAAPLNPTERVDLAPIFQAIEDDLKSQFLIGVYLNEKANDGKRHIVSLSVPAGLEFQVLPRGYSRTEKFIIDRPREALKRRD